MAKRELTPEQKEHWRAYQRAWRAQRSPEEKERVKAAKREYMRERSLDATPEEKAARREAMRQWSDANKEHKSKYMRERYQLKRADILTAETARYIQKRDEILAKLRQKYWENPEVTRVRAREHRASHLEERRAASRAWNKANPEKKLAHIRNRRALKKSIGGRHTAADVTRLYEAQRGVCAGCDAVLIAKGRGKYHVDHVMPIKLGGSNWPENLQLLCPPCNLSKNAQHPDAWARERGRLFA